MSSVADIPWMWMRHFDPNQPSVRRSGWWIGGGREPPSNRNNDLSEKRKETDLFQLWAYWWIWRRQSEINGQIQYFQSLSSFELQTAKNFGKDSSFPTDSITKLKEPHPRTQERTAAVNFWSADETMVVRITHQAQFTERTGEGEVSIALYRWSAIQRNRWRRPFVTNQRLKYTAHSYTHQIPENAALIWTRGEWHSAPKPHLIYKTTM